MEMKILEIKPETKYQGRTYEQSVVIETKRGTIFGLFDDDMVVGQSQISETVDFGISILPKKREVTKLECNMKKIVPSQSQPRGYTNHEYFGVINKISNQHQGSFRADIDVGDGNIHTTIFENYNSDLEIGDPVHVVSSRSDVFEPPIE